MRGTELRIWDRGAPPHSPHPHKPRVQHPNAVMRIDCLGSEGLEGFGGGAEFGDAGEDGFDRVAVIFGAAIGHGVGDEYNVVAVVVGAASGGFDADGGGDTDDENLGDIAAAEIGVEVGADECAGVVLGDEMVRGFYVELGDELGPVGW